MAADLLGLIGALFLLAYAAILVIDARTRRIPNLITYPLLALAVVARPDGIGVVPLERAIVAAITFGIFAAFTLRGWMGMGDAKLAAIIALTAPPAVAATALWLAFVAGAVAGLLLIAARRTRLGAAIPFGPFLALAGMVAVLVPDEVSRWSPFRALFA